MRHRIAVVGGLLSASAAHADHYQPLREEPGAVAAGAAAVTEATKAEKTDKHEALLLFRNLAAEHPAALHECYLALAHLRVGNLTEAKLTMDIAAQMGGERPKWCTGAVAQELAKKLADAHYIEVRLDVTPPETQASVNGVIDIVGLPSFWWPDGQRVGIWFTALGYDNKNQNFTPTAADPKVSIRLEPTKAAPPPEPTPPPSPSPSPPPTPPPSPPASPSPSPMPTPPPAETPPVHHGGQKTIALGVTLGSVALAGASFYLTHYFHDQANGRYPSDPRFDDSHSRWELSRDLGLGFSGLALAAGGYFLYLAITGDRDVPNVDQPGLHVQVAPHGAGVTYGWTLP